MMEPDPPAFAQSPAQQQQQQTYQEPANPIFQTNQQPPHPYQRQQQVPPQQAHPRQQTNMFQQHPQQSQSQNQQPPPPAPPAPLTTQPVPPNDPSVTAKLNEKLLPFSLFDAVLDVPFPGASTASPMELIFPPSDVSSGVVDALSLEDLKKEFGEENGSGGQGGAKVARFAFPDYEDRAYAQELAQRQEYKSRFPGGPELNRYDAYLEETLSPINASGNVNNNYTSANANSPNSNGPKLPSYHTFSHRLANGTTVHCHVRKYLPYHTQAAGRLDVGRRGVRALVLLTRNAGGGNRLYMALLKALEVLTLEAGALSQDVCCKGEEKKEETEDVAMNSSMGIRYRRHFLHAVYKEHMNLCREVAAALASGAKSVLAKPRILTLPLTEVGNGHGLFGAVDTLRLVVPSSFLHEREPTVSGSESIAALSRNDMLPMLRCLGVTRTMRLLSALMSERRIIFTSTNVSKLAAVGYGAVAMMGQGLLPPPPVFVPVLPPGLASLLQTPSPYLIGVLTGPTPHFINLRNVPNIGEVVLFDLDTSGNEPFFAGIPNPQQAVPDLTRRNMDEFDSANRVSLPDILYQDLTEVMKLDKRMFWQGAVQEKLGLVAERGRTAAKNAMKKGLQYFKNKSKEMKAKDSFGTENVEDEEVEEEAAATNSVENALSKSVGKGNYFYEQGFCHEAAELEARVAFTTFFVCILGDLRTYLTQQTPGTSPVVDKEKFMRFRNSSGDTPGTAMFLLCGNLMRGKIFDSFVEARMLEVQLRRAVPEDAPIFALTTNFHRSNKVDFYVNNVKNSVRQVASDADFPGRHLISWNEGVRRRVTELTSAQAFNGDPVKALSLLTEDCRESSVILIDAVMVFWTRILEGKGMQWKKALLALQMFRNLLLNGPINAVSEAIDGFASIRILRSYTEALRGQNSALIREAASELYLLIVDLPVLFARRRQFLNMRRLERDPKPSPLRKETRMVRGINQFRNVHIALRPAGASVAPAPPAVDDLLAREAPNTTASAPPPRGFSEDLLALGDPGASTPPHIAAGGEQSSANPFDMTTLSQAIPSNNYDASQHPTMSNSAPVPSTFPTQQQGTYQSDQKTHPIQLQQPSIPQTQPNQHHTQQPPQGQSSATMSQTSQQIHTQPNQLSMSHQTQPSMPEQSPYISSSMHRIQTDPQAQQTSIPAPQTQTMQQYTGLQNQNPQYSQPPHLINSSSPMNNIVHRPQGQFNTSSAASIPTAPNMNPQSRVPLAYGGVHPLPQMQSPHHHNQFVPGIQPSPHTVQNGGPTYQNTSQRPLGHSTGTNGPPTGPSPAGYQMMQSSQQFQQGGMQHLTNNQYTQQPRASNPNQLGGIQQPGQQQQSMPKPAYSNFDPLAR